ncbi:MAG TPA: FAD/NAD(P)-binding protein, partial [Flavitalea sp.]|nr:FAD/NAD(P)-binding protein [Flavitalea sp.]
MNSTNNFTSIALLGGGPAALFMYKRLVDSGLNYEVHIFERNSKLGAGMPYSFEGANEEHVTNVSDNEIPDLVNSIEEWLPKAPDHLLHKYHINEENFNEFKVVPRLFFGEYLSAQFERLIKAAKHTGLTTVVHSNTEVTDIFDDADSGKVRVITDNEELLFDQVVICTGHMWPKKNEGKVAGYFDSPYPPAKLVLTINYPVALRGSSLTAFDAIRTLSRSNGCFAKNDQNKLIYQVNKDSDGFKIVMHSLDGLLPAIRIHLEDSHPGKELAMSERELKDIRELNDGFVPLDYLFEEKFKASFRKKDPEFYARIRSKNLEEFVEDLMSFRESVDPFTLFRMEYIEAEKSIRRQEPVHWKEMLAVLSFTMNYPAKYFPAEDMLRLKKVLMPLISIVIAFVPQSSAEELLAL